MYAGAASVVASLWKVDDESTAELMKRFYTTCCKRESRRRKHCGRRKTASEANPMVVTVLLGRLHSAGRIPQSDQTRTAPNRSETAISDLIGLAAMGMLLWLSYRRMRNGRRTYSSVNR
jgi:hypothetical protein